MRPLAIYDTGIGGLSLINPLKKYLPEISFTYVTDMDYIIYDSKTGFGEIQERCKRIVTNLFEMKSNLVLLAAHSLTTTSLGEIQNRWLVTEYPSQGKNVIGLFLPMNQTFVERNWDLRSTMGVLLASQLVIRTGHYQQEALKKGFNNLMCIPSDKLTRAIEFGGDVEIEKALDDILKPFKLHLSKVHYVLLGATHYHFVKDKLAERFGTDTLVFDPLEQMAEGIANYIHRHPEYKIDNNGQTKYYTTGKPKDLQVKIQKYLGQTCEVEQLVIKDKI